MYNIQILRKYNFEGLDAMLSCGPIRIEDEEEEEEEVGQHGHSSASAMQHREPTTHMPHGTPFTW